MASPSRDVGPALRFLLLLVAICVAGGLLYFLVTMVLIGLGMFGFGSE